MWDRRCDLGLIEIDELFFGVVIIIRGSEESFPPVCWKRDTARSRLDVPTPMAGTGAGANETVTRSEEGDLSGDEPALSIIDIDRPLPARFVAPMNETSGWRKGEGNSILEARQRSFLTRINGAVPPRAFTGLMNRGWRHFPHTADLGVCGWGDTVEAAFEEAALGLIAAVTSSIVAPAQPIAIACRSSSLDLLLVAWLNAVIYEMTSRQMLFGRFDVHIAGNTLSATAWGEPIDRSKHEPICEPKGATLTELQVRRDTDGTWTARCVIDV